MVIKSIIHLADIHIRTYKLHTEYNESFNKLYIKLREYMLGFEYNEVRIVVAGDLVHQKITISNEQLILCCDFLTKLSKIAPVVIIAGNHDLLENNKDRLDSISPMIQLLDNNNISYLKESICYPDENIVWCNYSIFEENARPNIEDGRAKYGDKTYVGLFHGPIIGAKTDVGYEFEHGTSLEYFDGCDMVLLGDIHKRSEFNHNGIPIKFSGSLIQQNFGETVSKHGYTIWDVNTKSNVDYELENDYSFYHFKITSVDDVQNNVEKLINE